MHLTVAMTGATGSIFGIRLLQRLRELPEVQTHLILSRWSVVNLTTETDYHADDVKALAHHVYQANDLAAKLSSGSARMDAMVVVPCTMRTLAAIRHGLADNLVVRAADVALKEGRRLVLVPRETPFNSIHLENMLELSRLGVRICPPMPSFYSRPESVDDIVDHIVVRILDQLDLEIEYDKRWAGLPNHHDVPD
ncbi:UbiX family flavin prenyltransferase [Nocardia sp. alder85J]|uniref:UbiX family flavin prenyltransferase n=1 Tax=Nocardia sp. alder85J TaxID=2862949 RepID=UPI001CD26AF4|nr:UbiX family flavin prenyltransferase [Nocardia sp. alder85J]MCX4093840.1 UbiX family flavin prenyltransferase [Nocardia sp. alder85J]